ncbi:RluA family pseudouridine synthase [Parvularcula sp. IMCC14364]|uniref:RluA family pseudouridine synthase n=1 Tax=Parvularcula sp. IMCC14364 TaxID=3067902 RepID=UPI0027423522|nr:RluA family pseudouridine synthase [Parvularcula sp. IMCC14364]
MTIPEQDNKQNELLAFSVAEEDAGARLDKWLADCVEDLSRSRLKALIADGLVRRDESIVHDASAKIRVGETYQLQLPAIEEAEPEPEDIPLDILFEDADLIIINKPAGMVVHPGAGNQTGTLVNALLHHCRESLSGIGGVARPGIVHRLDKDTSGVMVVAKNDAAHHGLSELFATHTISRTYLAIVHGSPRPGLGTIATGIARASQDRKKMAVADIHEHQSAREAITHYKVRETYGQGRAKLPGDSLAALVACQLETGRTHQIRVHMAHIGHPLLGDQTYGRGPGLSGLRPVDEEAITAIDLLRSFRRQALHATELGFDHPVTGEPLSFTTEPPVDFGELQAALRTL